MNWNTISHFADVLGIFSFLLSAISLGLVRRLYAKAEMQREIYKEERNELLVHLMAIRENIWNDGLISPQIQDTLQSKVYEYQMKYLFISSPRCIFHAFRCTNLLRKGINNSNTQKIRQDVSFLIARLSKKE